MVPLPLAVRLRLVPVTAVGSSMVCTSTPLSVYSSRKTAVASLASAEARKESRGSHDRADYHQRDDANWIKHTLWYKDGNRLEYKPVHTKPLSVEAFEPKARVY